MKIKPSASERNLPFKGTQPPRPNRHIGMIIAAFLVILPTGYWLWREIQLHSAQQLIPNCFKHQQCADNLSALEQLVKAKKSLKFLNLKNANLEQANLESANLEKANLENANLSNAHLEKAKLKNANLANSQDFRIHLENAHLEYANFAQAHLEQSYLIYTDLRGARLDQTHLEHAYLNHANLQGVHLHHADFEQANFQSADLSHTYLYHSNFHRANLERANLEGAHLIEAQNLTPAQIKSACNWEEAFYQGYWTINLLQWQVNYIGNHRFINQLKQDQASDPKKPVDCREWE